MGAVTTALEPPSLSGLFDHWTVQPVAIVIVVALAVAYARGVRALQRPWPVYRSVLFAVGLAVLLWTSCGFLQVYADSLYWVWTTQTLTLWLGVPVLILAGQPVQLAQAVSGAGSRVTRVLESKPVRVLGNPLIGPALVPILSFVLFFGSVPRWAIESSPAGWLVQTLVLAVGAIMVIPLVGLDETASSLAVGFSLAIGSFELVIDAVPGIALRLPNSLVTSYFDHRVANPWAMSPLHDQARAGGILWCVAELIDLPFLVLVFRRWLRADARDAARIDAVLAAERASRRGLHDDDLGADPDAPSLELVAERDVPWWLSDPEMQKRLRKQR